MSGIDHRLLAAHQFAILNPVQLERQQWVDLPTTGLAPSVLSSKAQTLPQLLDLTVLSDERRDALLERAARWDRDSDAPFFSLLIKSESKAELVAAHLSRQLVVRAPDGSDVLLRWYDPRVMRHLHWLLTPAQLRAISGSVSAWSWCDDTGLWTSREVPAAVDATARLRLDSEQWSVVGRLGVLNRTVRQIARNAPSLHRDDSFYRRIDASLGEAYDRHKLTDEADARLFAEHAVRYPGIHALPDIARRLTKAQQGEVSYVGACAGLDIDSIYVQERNPLRKDAVT